MKNINPLFESTILDFLTEEEEPEFVIKTYESKQITKQDFQNLQNADSINKLKLILFFQMNNLYDFLISNKELPIFYDEISDNRLQRDFLKNKEISIIENHQS